MDDELMDAIALEEQRWDNTPAPSDIVDDDEDDYCTPNPHRCDGSCKEKY